MKKITKKSKTMKKIEIQEKLNIEEILRSKYIDENKPAIQIANELGVSYATIFHWLSLFGIYSRKLKL